MFRMRLARRTAISWARSRELTPQRLSAAIAELLADEDRLRAMSIAARRLAKPDAAERIADEVLRASDG